MAVSLRPGGDIFGKEPFPGLKRVVKEEIRETISTM